MPLSGATKATGAAGRVPMAQKLLDQGLAKLQKPVKLTLS